MSGKKSKQARRAEKWAKQSKGGKWINWDLAWKVLASIFSFAGSMVAIYESVNYFRSDAQTFYSLIIPGLAIIIWLIILVQLFRKKNPYAILLLAFTVLGGVVGGIGWRSYNDAQESKVIVLVAQFDGPEEKYGLRRQIMEDLRKATKGDDETIIIEGSKIVTSSEYARELGNEVKADLVIWAWYRPTENPNITIHIENLSPNDIETLRESEIYHPQASLADLESFTIQHKLGSETSSLISFLLGLLDYEDDEFQEAIEHFESILFEEDISACVDPDILYFNIGASYYKLGKLEQSIQYYDKAIELSPTNSGFYNNRGIAYGSLEKYERAIDDFNEAIKLDPNNTVAYDNRGFAYVNLGQYERGIADFDQVIAWDPNNVDAYYSRGIAYQDLGQYDRAIKDYDKAIELDQNYAFAYTNRGIVYYDLKQYDLAIQDYNNAIKLAPERARAYYNRGLAYCALGEYERAFQDYDKAIEIDPDNTYFYRSRGDLYMETKQYDQAIQDFTKVIELDHNFTSAYYSRGYAYRALGKITEAEADFKKYEELTGQKP